MNVHTRQLFIQPALEVESLSFNAYNKPNVICKEADFLNNLNNGKGWGEERKIKFLAHDASKQMFPRQKKYTFFCIKSDQLATNIRLNSESFEWFHNLGPLPGKNKIFSDCISGN